VASSSAEPRLDIGRILETLDRHGVEYLAVGGIAALVYGAARPTRDVDCLAGRSPGNLARLAAAMRELGARLRVGGLDDEEAASLPVVLDAQMLANSQNSTWRTDAGDLDILAEIRDRDGRRAGYEELVQRAERHEFGGVTITVASLDDVIASKEYANRPKDHQALPELHELRRAQAEAELGWKRPEASGPPVPDGDPGGDFDL
jgi:hypothetical protein